jgi:hypothetical protein
VACAAWRSRAAWTRAGARTAHSTAIDTSRLSFASDSASDDAAVATAMSLHGEF